MFLASSRVFFVCSIKEKKKRINISTHFLWNICQLSIWTNKHVAHMSQDIYLIRRCSFSRRHRNVWRRKSGILRANTLLFSQWIDSATSYFYSLLSSHLSIKVGVLLCPCLFVFLLDIYKNISALSFLSVVPQFQKQQTPADGFRRGIKQRSTLKMPETLPVLIFPHSFLPFNHGVLTSTPVCFLSCASRAKGSFHCDLVPPDGRDPHGKVSCRVCVRVVVGGWS